MGRWCLFMRVTGERVGFAKEFGEAGYSFFGAENVCGDDV
jgi:hypothetical protein